MNMGAEQQTRVKGAGGGGGSRFAAACGLLRQYQYMMRQAGGGMGGAAVTTMGLMPGADGVEAAAVTPTPEERIKTTIELLLFPQRPGTIKDNSHQRTILEPETAQLTIFYDGKTFVFDEFPADKADELMQLAGSFTTTDTSDDEPVYQNAPAQSFLADMPIARKASLQRFLEKRKSRLAAADPYPVPLMAPAARAAKETGKPVEGGGAPWLGVNSGLHLN